MRRSANVYEEAKREDVDAGKINPMELWDLHHIRRLDDAGFIDGLYGNSAGRRPADSRADRRAEEAAGGRG